MKKGLLFMFAVLFGFITIQAQQSFSTDPNAENGVIIKNDINQTDVAFMITHSSTQSIVSGNSVSCNAGGLHTNNSYWRVFDLANDFGISNDWEVQSVDVAVETAVGATGSQPVTVNLYTLDGTLSLANLTLIYSEDFSVGDAAAGTVLNLPLTTPVTVLAGSVLVYEFFTPDGQTDGNSFFIGSNTDAETDASYLAAADCGITEPTAVSAIGFPGMHIVMNVWGDYLGDLYTVTFNVDNGTDPIEGATVVINGETLTTDVSGVATIDLLDGDYPYTVDFGTCTQATGTVTVNGGIVTENVSLDCPSVYAVTFNVDMNIPITAGTFVVGTDIVYISGDIWGWAEPGTNATLELTDDDTDGIYSGTFDVEDGDWEYKYFQNAGWDGGEWQAGGNRLFTVAGAAVTNDDVWGENSVQDVLASYIKVYPNPSQGVFNINVENNFNLEVFDIAGKVINTQVIDGNTTLEINTAGVYFLRFSNNEGSVTQRVVVQ